MWSPGVCRSSSIKMTPGSHLGNPRTEDAIPRAHPSTLRRLFAPPCGAWVLGFSVRHLNCQRKCRSINKSKSSQLAREAKAIVALAFRNGPIEDIHAGKLCPTCAGKPEYSHISQPEVKRIMKNAVDHVYRLLSLRENDPGKYETMVDFGAKYTGAWDEPAAEEQIRARAKPL
jgi:hypothetical protein